MRYSICFIEDTIPASKADFMDDTKQLNSSDIRYLLDRIDPWEEQEVKDLVSKLIEDDETWKLTAFTHPAFFINCLNEELFRPDVIILDWEFRGSTDTLDDLWTILKESFSLIYIYTHTDMIEELKLLFKQDEFKAYNARLRVLSKTGKNSVEVLVAQVQELIRTNFSFKFGSQLRRESLQAVEKILVGLGRVTLNQVSNYFKLTAETKRDLIDFIAERFRNQLSSVEFSGMPEGSSEQSGEYDHELARQLWSYRLYYYPASGDTIVRRGDLIEKKGDLFLVVTADCDLNRHWHKNFGYVNLLQLHRIDAANTYISEQIMITRKASNVNPSVSSLTGKINELVEGPFILPFVKWNDASSDYIAFPKELMSKKIDISPRIKEVKAKKNAPLQYDENFNYKRVASISEPFLTPLIQHIFNTLSGYGTPEYPGPIGKVIADNLKASL